MRVCEQRAFPPSESAALDPQATTMINGVSTAKLCETVSPEAKRKIIGDTFMRVTQKIADELDLKVDDVYLAQVARPVPRPGAVDAVSCSF